MRIGTACWRVRRIFSTLAVHMVKALRFQVVGFKIVVRNRPGRRSASIVADLAKVFLAQTEQRGPIELSVTTDIVVCMRMQLRAVPVVPHLLGVVLTLGIDGATVPVLLFPRYVVAAFQQEDAFARGCQVVG